MQNNKPQRIDDPFAPVRQGNFEEILHRLEVYKFVRESGVDPSLLMAFSISNTEDIEATSAIKERLTTLAIYLRVRKWQPPEVVLGRDLVFGEKI